MWLALKKRLREGRQATDDFSDGFVGSSAAALKLLTTAAKRAFFRRVCGLWKNLAPPLADESSKGPGPTISEGNGGNKENFYRRNTFQSPAVPVPQAPVGAGLGAGGGGGGAMRSPIDGGFPANASLTSSTNKASSRCDATFFPPDPVDEAVATSLKRFDVGLLATEDLVEALRASLRSGRTLKELLAHIFDAGFVALALALADIAALIETQAAQLRQRESFFLEAVAALRRADQHAGDEGARGHRASPRGPASCDTTFVSCWSGQGGSSSVAGATTSPTARKRKSTGASELGLALDSIVESELMVDSVGACSGPAASSTTSSSRGGGHDNSNLSKVHAAFSTAITAHKVVAKKKKKKDPYSAFCGQTMYVGPNSASMLAAYKKTCARSKSSHGGQRGPRSAARSRAATGQTEDLDHQSGGAGGAVAGGGGTTTGGVTRFVVGAGKSVASSRTASPGDHVVRRGRGGHNDVATPVSAAHWCESGELCSQAAIDRELVSLQNSQRALAGTIQNLCAGIRRTRDRFAHIFADVLAEPARPHAMMDHGAAPLVDEDHLRSCRQRAQLLNFVVAASDLSANWGAANDASSPRIVDEQEPPIGARAASDVVVQLCRSMLGGLPSELPPYDTSVPAKGAAKNPTCSSEVDHDTVWQASPALRAFSSLCFSAGATIPTKIETTSEEPNIVLLDGAGARTPPESPLPPSTSLRIFPGAGSQLSCSSQETVLPDSAGGTSCGGSRGPSPQLETAGDQNDPAVVPEHAPGTSSSQEGQQDAAILSANIPEQRESGASVISVTAEARRSSAEVHDLSRITKTSFVGGVSPRASSSCRLSHELDENKREMVSCLLEMVGGGDFSRSTGFSLFDESGIAGAAGGQHQAAAMILGNEFPAEQSRATDICEVDMIIVDAASREEVDQHCRERTNENDVGKTLTASRSFNELSEETVAQAQVAALRGVTANRTAGEENPKPTVVENKTPPAPLNKIALRLLACQTPDETWVDAGHKQHHSSSSGAIGMSGGGVVPLDRQQISSPPCSDQLGASRLTASSSPTTATGPAAAATCYGTTVDPAIVTDNDVLLRTRIWQDNEHDRPDFRKGNWEALSTYSMCWRPVEILEVIENKRNLEDVLVRVHYVGYDNRYDELIPDSPGKAQVRLRPAANRKLNSLSPFSMLGGGLSGSLLGGGSARTFGGFGGGSRSSSGLGAVLGFGGAASHGRVLPRSASGGALHHHGTLGESNGVACVSCPPPGTGGSKWRFVLPNSAYQTSYVDLQRTSPRGLAPREVAQKRPNVSGHLLNLTDHVVVDKLVNLTENSVGFLLRRQDFVLFTEQTLI